MFTDMHLHTSGISRCAKKPYNEMLDNAKENGYDAVVISNHYTKAYFTEENHSEWIEEYLCEFYKCEKYGKEIGIKVFFGIEVTFEESPAVHFLIYGADEHFLRKNQFLCFKTQKELYNLCRENGCVLVQAHPFRGGASVMSPELLDGIEINCHPGHGDSHSEEIIKIAKENNLALTVGCDYHADNYRPLGGMFLPDYINSGKELADYIIKKEKTKVQIQEPTGGGIRKVYLNESTGQGCPES